MCSVVAAKQGKHVLERTNMRVQVRPFVMSYAPLIFVAGLHLHLGQILLGADKRKRSQARSIADLRASALSYKQ